MTPNGNFFSTPVSTPVSTPDLVSQHLPSHCTVTASGVVATSVTLHIVAMLQSVTKQLQSHGHRSIVAVAWQDVGGLRPCASVCEAV